MYLKKVANMIFYMITSLMILIIIAEVFLPLGSMQIIGFKIYAVPTPSMEPVIRVGDLIIVTKPNLDQLDENHIISFYADLNQDGVPEVITHQIRSIVYEDDIRLFKTYGINNPSDDTFRVTDQDIVGVYRMRIPLLGYVVLFLKILVSQPIFLGLVLLNILIIVVLIKFIKRKPEVRS
jgi:signal peptidase I